PGEEGRSPRRTGKLTCQRKPLLLWNLTLRDGHKTCKPCFRCQQIIVACISPPIADVISNAHQMTRLVVQEVVFDAGEIRARQGELLNLCHPIPSTMTRL